MVNITNAQNNNLIGLYSLGSSNPEGGSHLFVLENGKFAITYFGGIQTGNWELVKENTYRFSPNTKQNEFELYGRHNKAISNEVKIFFNGFEEGETFVGVGSKEKEACIMNRVFNLDANCFSFPYVHTFKIKGDSISFMSDEGEKDNPIVTFSNPENYNDFVALFHKRESESEPFLAKFAENKLYFNDGSYVERSHLPEDGEDIEFIREFTEQDRTPDYMYFNPFYNMFDDDINKHYVFNDGKNAFIDKRYYTEGDEYLDPENSFDNMSIIYSFKILKSFSSESIKYKVNEKPLFEVTCD